MGIDTTPLYIGGKAEYPTATCECRNPISQEIVSISSAASIDDANRAAEAAAKAFPSWAALGPSVRRDLLNAAAESLSSKADKIVDAMTSELGATAAWGGFNVAFAASIIREAAAMTTQIGGEVIPSDKAGCLAMSVREPVGVVLGIAPWNAPVILGVRAIAMPLACGNTVILKSSEFCPLTYALIVEAFIEAGLGDGVVNLISNSPDDASEIVGALIDHPAVSSVNFTGSTHVGRIIAMRAAGKLKPALLELGGKAPFIVLEDADLDEAVKAAAFGAYMNQGQICMSTERVILVESIAEQFMDKFVAKVKTLTVGDPAEGHAVLGAVVNKKSVSHVGELIAEAVDDGALKVLGEEAKGVLMPATIVDYVTPQMRLFREESFGPVVAISRVKDEDGAIELANDTKYGLSAAIFTQDAARGFRLAKRIDSGICHINGPTVGDEPQMPFGGVKASGYGRFGGKAGIESFTQLRWITLSTEPGHYPI